MSKDILLYETGNGGDFLILNNDLTLVENLFQQCYLLLFGGNLESSTTGSELPNQIRNDWWGNSLFFPNSTIKQFNSETEKMLDSVSLNTSGRIDIERAVKSDLKDLRDVSNINVNVVILSSSRVSIQIGLERPEQIEDKLFQFIWDNAANELIINRNI